VAEAKDFQSANYPLPVYNYRVTVGGTSMSFSQVSGISLEYTAVTYKHGLSYTEGQLIRKFFFEEYIPVTLKKGTVKGANDLYEWVTDTENEPRTLDVSLCDEEGVPAVTWRIAKALAVKVDAPDFDPNSNDVSIESLELLASGISVIHH